MRLGQPFVELAPAPVDVGLIGHGDDPRPLVGRKGCRVTFLVRVAAADQEDAVRGIHGVSPALSGRPERSALSISASRSLSGAGSAPASIPSQEMASPTS